MLTPGEGGGDVVRGEEVSAMLVGWFASAAVYSRERVNCTARGKEVLAP